MTGTKVGIREFREKLSDYLGSPKPVAITRHGTTIGFYIPAPQKPNQADLEALRRAGEQLEALIAAAGTNEEQLVADFKESGRNRRQVRS